MRAQWNTRVLILIAVLFLIGHAEAQQLPKSVTIVTNPAGTVFCPVAGGLASVISGGAPSVNSTVSTTRYTMKDNLSPQEQENL